MTKSIIIPLLSVDAKIKGPSPECQQATASKLHQPHLFFSFPIPFFPFLLQKIQLGAYKV